MSNPGPASSVTVNTVTASGNVAKMVIASIVLSPASVAANTTAEQTFAVTGMGLLAGDYVAVNKPTAQAGLGIVGARAAGTDSLAVTFSNNTAGAIVPTASETYLVKAERMTSGALTAFA